MKKLVIVLLLAVPGWLFSQQISDSTYQPDIPYPEYNPGEGPVVFIDAGHHNFHTKDGRYRAFSNLLERDGYTVVEYEGEFEKDKLVQGKILVISNALNEINVRNWYLPTPSAFTASEIEIVRQWVFEGGSLFLIADHMPMAGAAEDLAAVFGFGFTNGFAIDTSSRRPDFFNIEDKTLHKNIITKGRNDEESLNQIVTFTGQAFKLPDDAITILTFNQKYLNFLPDTAWVFDDKTKIYNAEGWSQGAFKKYGKGRVVAFGEAAMFTAQLAGPQNIRVGLNSDYAPENYKLLLNVIHWLDGKLD